MANSGAEKDPGRCDTKDRGVTPERLVVLQNEAHAFNQMLRAHEPGPRTVARKEEIAKADKDFYAFLPGDHSQSVGSFDASKAFYEQLTQLPIGERKKLLELTGKENEEMHAADPKMPLMVVDMYPDAFIKSLDFQMRGEYYTFQYLGMCAELKEETPNQYPEARRGWGFTLPTFNFRR